jgi:hypothetical protein
MFAGRSVRMRWPLFAADYGESFGGVAWEIRDKGIVRESSGVEKQGRKSRGPVCLSRQARDDDFQLVYAPTPVAPQPTNHRARADDAAAAGARSPTTDTLILRLSFYVDQSNILDL